MIGKDSASQINLFRLSKIAVYQVDAEGIMMEHIYEASSSARSSSGTAGHTAMDPYMAGAGEHADTISAMERIATSTGGKAYYNTNDLNGAMQRAIHDGANYYTIAVAPFVWTGFSGFKWKDCSVVVVAVGM